MKLGKALATGVAEEAPRIRDSRDAHDNLRDPRDEGTGTAQEITGVAVSLPEEVPAAR